MDIGKDLIRAYIDIGKDLIKAYDKGYADCLAASKQEWISVDERLPEEDGWYNTYTNATGKSKGVIPQRLETATIRGNKTRRWMHHARLSPWNVTHWMPLPEPPKEGDGE